MIKDCVKGLLKQIKKLRTYTLFAAFVIPPSPYTTLEIDKLKQHFVTNITAQGAVMASPSKTHPNYYFHWVRDAAIAMSLVQEWYEKDRNQTDEKRLKQYVEFVNTTQHAIPTPGYELLGEPKFYLDGNVFMGSWGRPQNDGPALRALTLIRFANTLLDDKNNDTYVRTHLYAPSLDYDEMGVIKRDLEYIATHWRNKSVDLWEESTGYHYFTSAVQQKALYLGAILAKRLNDPSASQYYENEAVRMSSLLDLFIDLHKLRLKASLLEEGPNKPGNIDSSILLAVLLTLPEYALDRPIIHNTIDSLNDYFKNAFRLNEEHSTVLVGRYPNDSYDGYETNQLGNAWPLLTATLAEYQYRIALHAIQMNNERQASLFLEKGDALLKRIKHLTPNLHLSEQLNRDTGESQGANDLTWSYQALLKALNSRKKLTEAILF